MAHHQLHIAGYQGDVATIKGNHVIRFDHLTVADIALKTKLGVFKARDMFPVDVASDRIASQPQKGFSLRFTLHPFSLHLRLYQMKKPVTGREAAIKLARKANILPGSPKMDPTWIS